MANTHVFTGRDIINGADATGHPLEGVACRVVRRTSGGHTGYDTEVAIDRQAWINANCGPDECPKFWEELATDWADENDPNVVIQETRMDPELRPIS